MLPDEKPGDRFNKGWIPATNWEGRAGYVKKIVGELGLQRRIQLLMALGLLLIFIFFWLAGQRAVAESARHTLDHQLNVANLIASLLDSRLDTALTLLARTAGRPDLRTGRVSASQAMLLQDAQRQFGAFGRRLLWLDADGRVLWTEPPDPALLGQPFSDFGAVQPALNQKIPYISNLCLASEPARPYILLAVPIDQPEAGFATLLVEEIEAAQLGLDNILKQIAPGKNAYIQVIDREGNILASSAADQCFETVNHAVQFSRLVDNRQPMVGRCHQCHPGGSRQEETIRTDEVLAFAPLHTVQWGVAIRQPASEVVAPVNALRQQILLGGGVVLIVTLLVTSWFIGRQIIGPLQIVDRASTQWASGNLNVPIPNVGIDEMAQLTTNLEQMRTRLDATLEDQRRWNEALSEMVEERTHELAVLYEQVQSKEMMCRRLLGKVLTTQEEERARLARELHDAIGQALTAIIMTTTAVESNLPDDCAGGKEKLNHVRNVATQALQDLRSLIFDLRPEILDDLGLALALRSQVKKYLEPAGVKVRLRAAGLKDQLPPDVERAIFRVVQEAITNIARHAQATDTNIILTIKDNRLIVRIEDDGIGFDPDRVLRGQRQAWGLYGMKERITLLGGTLYVGSKPGEGTLLLAEVPL